MLLPGSRRKKRSGAEAASLGGPLVMRTLDGGKAYKLTVPANVPAHDFWSVEVYDRTL
ncbi:DUF1214 domain-containing protein [Desulfosarcina sp. BuS5]|uniref:DUF1214 domain-containing protein n=1 Tax=Desulfosarcina sp. BuS5 TaxID=933262 RepID=UPI0018DD2C39